MWLLFLVFGGFVIGSFWVFGCVCFFFVLLLEVATCAWRFCLFLWLVFCFCLVLGLGVVVVVNVTLQVVSLPCCFCLVVVVARFRVHNTFAGFEWVGGFLVLFAFGLLVGCVACHKLIARAEATAVRFLPYTPLFILQIDLKKATSCSHWLYPPLFKGAT
jgi:hypothetical protein